MRVTHGIVIALGSAALGLMAGQRLKPVYSNAAASSLEKAHCVFEPVKRQGAPDIAGRLVTLVPAAGGAISWLMDANTVGPDAQLSQHPDGAWTATAIFTAAPGAAMITVNARQDAVLSVHRPDTGRSTQVGTCLTLQKKEA